MVKRVLSRKKRMANRAVRNPLPSSSRALVPVGPSTQRMIPKTKNRRPMRQSPRLSNDGLAFLKCAFASPDWGVDPGKGIPDHFHGRVVSVRDCATNSVVFTPGKDTYILSSNVPGYAYFTCEVDIGADPVVFQGVPFPTYATNFGNAGSTNNFTKFRYAAAALGLYPTSNETQYSGSVQVWKADISLSDLVGEDAYTVITGSITTEESGCLTNCDGGETEFSYVSSIPLGTPTPGTLKRRIQGLESVVPLVPRDNYSDAFVRGAFSYAVDIDEFEWQNFSIAQTYQQNVVTSPKNLQWDGTNQLTGYGNLETIVLRVSTPLGAINTAVLRNWACLELQPNTNSSLYQFAHLSPEHDPLALLAYRRVAFNMPVSVPASQNSSAWERAKRIVNTVLGAAIFAAPPPFNSAALAASSVFNLGTRLTEMLV